MAIAVSAVSVAIVTVAITNLRLSYDRSAPVPAQPAPSAAVPQEVLSVAPAQAEAEGDSAFLVNLVEDPSPVAATLPSDPESARSANPGFASASPPALLSVPRAEPQPVLLFDSTAFPAPDLQPLAVAAAVEADTVEWQQPAAREASPPMAASSPIAALEKVEGIAPDMALLPPVQGGAETLPQPNALDVIAGAAPEPALVREQLEPALVSGSDDRVRLRREISTGISRLRGRATRPIAEREKSTLPEHAESRASLQPQEYSPALANVMVAGIDLGSAPIQVSGDHMVEIRLGELIELFESKLEKPLFVWLKNSSAASEYATVDTLRAAGLDARYDPATAQVSLSLIPEH